MLAQDPRPVPQGEPAFRVVPQANVKASGSHDLTAESRKLLLDEIAVAAAGVNLERMIDRAHGSSRMK